MFIDNYLILHGFVDIYRVIFSMASIGHQKPLTVKGNVKREIFLFCGPLGSFYILCRLKHIQTIAYDFMFDKIVYLILLCWLFILKEIHFFDCLCTFVTNVFPSSEFSNNILIKLNMLKYFVKF